MPMTTALGWIVRPITKLMAPGYLSFGQVKTIPAEQMLASRMPNSLEVILLAHIVKLTVSNINAPEWIVTLSEP